MGYLDILQELIKESPDSLTSEHYNELLIELVKKCLFTYDLKPLSSHIIKDTDIAAYEKPFINKC